MICDFAEYYHVFAIEDMPLSLAATLCAGLRDDSRIMKKLSGQKYSITEEMLMHIYDLVHWLQWAQTKDGANNRHQPKSIFKMLEDVKDEQIELPEIKKTNDVVIFDTEKDLLKALYG